LASGDVLGGSGAAPKSQQHHHRHELRSHVASTGRV
jgi:hypothetical protein